MNSLEHLRRIIRQQTVSVGQPVRNLYGGVLPSTDGVQVLRTASWAWLSVRNNGMLSLNGFLSLFTADPLRRVQTIQTQEGIGASTDYVDRDGDVVYTSTSLLVGTVRVAQAQAFRFTIAGVSSFDEFALYIDGVLVRRSTESLTYLGQLSAGVHTIQVVVNAAVFAFETAPDLVVEARQTLSPPAWVSAVGGYQDTTIGTPAAVLTWGNDPSAGGWTVYRRKLTTLGQILVVGAGGVSQRYGIEISGDWTASLAVGQTLYAGTEVIGLVLGVAYDSGTSRTLVDLRLPDGVAAPNPSIINRYVTAGVFGEVARLRRVSTGPAIEWLDTTVSTGVAYEYALQAFGLFDEQSVSGLSEIRSVVVGDSTAPGNITFSGGYPKVLNYRANVKFTTPSDTDYAGVNVYSRVVGTQGTATSGGTNTLTKTGAGWTTDQWAGYRVKITSGTGAGQILGVLSNTAEVLTMAANWITVPDGTSVYEVCTYTKVLTDYGVPATEDELTFEPVLNTIYRFVTFDHAGNEHSVETAVSWTYTTGDDTFTGGANQPPTVGIRQLLPSEQSDITGFTDPRLYAILELSALDPVDGTTGVTIEYKRRNDTSFTVGLPASADGYPTTVALDNPSGTRTRLVAVSRQINQNWLQVRASDAAALYSDLLTYGVDFNTLPEISSIESRLDPFLDTVTVEGVVDDDTQSLRWRLDTGSWTNITGLSTTKTFSFSFPLTDGQRKVLQLQVCSESPPTSVTINSSTNATPIVVTTSSAHGYADGDQVWIQDHAGNGAANGLWVITVTSTTQFSLNGSVGTGVGTATGTVVRNVGLPYEKEWMRPPRTTAVFENRSPDGAVSTAVVRGTFRMYPEPSAQDSGTSTGSNSTTTLNDTGKAWTANAFQYSETLRRFYYVRITGAGTAVDQLRRIVSNTATQLTVEPAWDVTPGAVTYQILTGGTSYRLGSSGGFKGAWGPVFFTRSVAGDTVEYYSEITGVTREPVQRSFIDADEIPAIGTLSLVETSAGVVTITISDIDEDAKTWELYLKKGTNAWPTLDGTQTGEPDPSYRRFAGPTTITAMTNNCGSGDWYALAVPYNSYGDRGTIKAATVNVTGSGSSGSLTSIGVGTKDDGSTAAYNRLYWDHNATLDSNNNWFVRVFAYRDDQGPASEVEVVVTDSGTATSGGPSTLTDSTKSGLWTADIHQNRWVYITSGTGAGQYRQIQSNTTTQLTTTSAWTTQPDSTSKYFISRFPRIDVDAGADYSNYNDVDGTASKGSVLHAPGEKRGTPSTGVYRTWHYTIELYEQSTLRTTYSVSHSDWYERPVTQFTTASATVSLHTGGACAGPDNKGNYYGDPPYTLKSLWDIVAGTENDTDYRIEVTRNSGTTAAQQNVRKAISSSTNASPIVITSTAHGFENGDVVSVEEHTTNTAANGTWTVANKTTNTFELQGSTGNGVGGATGFVVKNASFSWIATVTTTTEQWFDTPAGSKVVGEGSTTYYTTYQIRVVRKSDSVVLQRKTTTTRSDATIGDCTAL